MLKLPRESQWTPWGLAPSKSGANMRPIIAEALPDDDGVVFVLFCRYSTA